MGRSYSVSGSLELHERSCVAPVLRVFHLEDAALAVTSSDSYVLKFDDDGFSTVDRSKWHGILAVAKEQGGTCDVTPEKISGSDSITSERLPDMLPLGWSSFNNEG